jgi:hypothetical protein
MLYPKSALSSLDPELFVHPPSEYRGAPFWAWNAKLEIPVLLEQMENLRRMGFGGVHTHPRTGLDTPYLSEAFMDCIRACLAKAEADGMRLYLYDEDRWPSGFAGGLVSREERFRGRHILFTPVSYKENGIPNGDRPSYVKAVRTANGRLLAAYDIVLNRDGTLESYRTVGEDETVRGKKWYAYLESDLPHSWYNNQTYIDTLNPEAVKRFLELTHELYKKAVGSSFGKTIPSIFTDEPMYTYKFCLAFPDSLEDAVIPWTENFAASYQEEYGEDILARLPEIFWELPGGLSTARYRYHNHATDLFVRAFADTYGEWCDRNSILLTGHLMREPTLKSQNGAVGEAMRSYRAFGLPGVDMLANKYEYTTVKQAQSASCQYGREGVLSELYGITSWSFDFRDHKLQGDWQAALGVTLRVPHLSFYSMAGEAKRDYPASINYQSPWFKEYPLVEDHFARVNTALTRGKPLISTAVIHPIESFWLRYGPSSQTGPEQERLDRHFADVTQWLLFGAIDFHYISEALLPSQCGRAANPLKVGAMAYDTVIVPACETLRSTTVERLKVFRQKGGSLIFMGHIPGLVDAAPSGSVLELAQKSICIPFEKVSLMRALEPVRRVSFFLATGETASRYVHQLRADGDCCWLFIAQGKPPSGRDVAATEELKIVLKGSFAVEEYNTLTGKIQAVPVFIKDGQTILKHDFYPQDSLLLRLVKSQNPQPVAETRKPVQGEYVPMPSVVGVSFEEPNVLLLDRAEFALDGEPYAPAAELLQADNLLRERLGLPMRQGSIAQPWLVAAKPASHRVRLRFVVESAVELDSVMLAGEGLSVSDVVWNGGKAGAVRPGYYVDRSIEKLALGKLKKGANSLEVSFPFGERTNVEWYYILGDFGVCLKGKTAVISGAVHELAFGDICPQGLPFYGGNLSYHIPLPKEFAGRLVSLRVPHYRGPLLGVYAAGKRQGTIAFAPYTINFRVPEQGNSETVDIVLFGNRVNSFGAVHMVTDGPRYLAPQAWRTRGDAWSDEYVLEPAGILSSPRISLV